MVLSGDLEVSDEMPPRGPTRTTRTLSLMPDPDPDQVTRCRPEPDAYDAAVEKEIERGKPSRRLAMAQLLSAEVSACSPHR